jgi:hypothetical protein
VAVFAAPWLQRRPRTVRLGTTEHAQSLANSRRSHRTAAAAPEEAATAALVAADSGGPAAVVADTAPAPAAAAASSVRAVQSSLAVSRCVTHAVNVCAAHKKPRRALKWLAAVRSGSTNSSGGSNRGSGSSGSTSGSTSSDSGSTGSDVVPVLVFCNTISAVGAVSKLLAKHYGGGSGGGGVRALHGNMPQADREATLRAFVRGSAKPSSHGSHGSHGSHSSGQGCHTLVATDVAARGLHMPRLQHVLNYDFPPSLEQVREELAFVGRGQLFC